MAGSRHSAADIELIKACRKAVMDHAAATAAHAETMKTMFADLGDDLQDFETTVDSRAAETDAVRSFKPKAIKAFDTVSALNEILASTVTFWYKAHAAHWNLTGEDFPQYHAFFEDIYTEAFNAIDPTAEFIRTTGMRAPASLQSILALVPPDPLLETYELPEMLFSLQMDNMYMCDLLQAGIYYTGSDIGNFGIQNYLQDRLGYHQKLGWKLRAIMTPTTELPEPEEPEMEPAEETEAEAEPAMKTAPVELTPAAKKYVADLLYVLGGKR